jgi:hypothetical protein
MVRVLWVLTICFLSNATSAQINCFATARLNTTEVYPEQPIKVTITVLTETWFTQPLDFEPVTVSNAFVIPFKRTQSGIHHINNKQYAGLEFFFLIYPYASGIYEFPEVRVNVETPPVGGYKGQKVTVNTKPREFKVLDIPEDYEGNQWFIAKNVRISERWSKPLEEVKVGDVFERSITVSAAGTLPSFIPELELEETDFATIYPQEPELNDNRTRHDVNGVRIEKNLYLFEKEGSYEIPSVRVEWWNPYARRMYFKQLEAINITVKPNPDLGMLLSVKDSLNATESTLESGSDEGPTLWFGLLWWEFVLVGTGILILILLFFRAVTHLIKWILKKRHDYLLSERYFLGKIDRHKEAKEKINAVYAWLDRFHPDQKIDPGKWSDWLSVYFTGNKTTKDIGASDIELSSPKKGPWVAEHQQPLK